MAPTTPCDASTLPNTVVSVLLIVPLAPAPVTTGLPSPPPDAHRPLRTMHMPWLRVVVKHKRQQPHCLDAGGSDAGLLMQL